MAVSRFNTDRLARLGLRAAPPARRPGPAPNPPGANQTIRDALRPYGLEELADWWWSRRKAGWTDEQLWIEIRDTEAFKREFPEIEARSKAGLTPLSPGEIVQYRQQVQQIGSSMGLSPRVLSKQVMQRLLIADKSPAEVERRLTRGYAEIVNNAPEVVQTFTHWFGVQGNAAIAAFALDPKLGADELERMAAAAQIGGFGSRFGLDFTKQRGLELAQAGVSGENVQEGLARLSEIRPLFAETFTETRDLTAEKEGAESVFGLGSDEELRRRKEQRTAAGRGGGGAASSSRGVIGLGSAEG